VRHTSIGDLAETQQNSGDLAKLSGDLAKLSGDLAEILSN
jgi:hypothetical protein